MSDHNAEEALKREQFKRFLCKSSTTRFLDAMTEEFRRIDEAERQKEAERRQDLFQRYMHRLDEKAAKL